MATPAIECTDLTKIYQRRVRALSHLDLTIPSGVTCGLLGENGAGKTTLVRLLLGFIFPSSGQVRVLGEMQPAAAHARIGYVPEQPSLEPRLTARGYLTYLAQLSGLQGSDVRSRLDTLLRAVNLTAVADRRIGTFSKGMRQRLAIAQALLRDPELLIVDEPTSGLDPGGQWEVRQIITALRRQGTTMLLCSHHLGEVESLCDMVGILRRGHLVRCGAVAELLRGDGMIEIALLPGVSARTVVAQLDLRAHVSETRDSTMCLRYTDQSPVLGALVRAGIGITSLNPVTRSLEDLYVQVTRTSASEPTTDRVAATPGAEHGGHGQVQP